MASFWSRLWPWRRDVSRYNLSEYLAKISDPYVLMPTVYTTTGKGQPVEEIENNFTGYVYGAYKSDGVVFAVILARMLLFSEARFQWQRMSGGRPGDLFGTQDLGILEYPWPNGTTGELLARMEQDVSLSGNAYVVRENRRLRRLRPDWVQIVLSAPPDQAVESDVIGYLYTPGGPGATGETRVYLPEEMCHWSPIPDPEAQYRGMSWLTPVIRETEADKAATKHKLNFFHNGASPSMVFTLPKEVTREQFQAFVDANQAANTGTDNAYKPMYVGGGADATLKTFDFRQLDFKQTQGAGETRICAAGGVPPIIVGLSEGLQAATYSNYASARRKFGDHWARPQWRSASAALQTIVPPPPGGGVRLWYDDRDIAFLREDMKDAAEIQQIKAATIRTLVDAGFEPKSVVAAVDADDRSLLVHTGLYSVQLQPPGTAQLPSPQPLALPAGRTPALNGSSGG